MNKLEFKKNEIGLYLDDAYGYLLHTIGEQLLNDVKLHDFIDMKLLVKKMTSALDNYTVDSDNTFASKLYSKKIMQYVDRIFKSHGIELNNYNSIYDYSIIDYDNEALDYKEIALDACDLLRDNDCYLSDDDIAKNLQLDDIYEYVNEITPKIISEKNRIDSVEKELMDSDIIEKAHAFEKQKMDLECIIEIFQSYYNENEKNNIISNIKGAINEFGSLYTDPNDIDENSLNHSNDYVISAKQISRIISQLHEYIIYIIKKIEILYKFNDELIHDIAINKIKELEIYNDLDVKTVLDDVKGLEVDYSMNDTNVLDKRDDADYPEIDNIDNLHGHKL